MKSRFSFALTAALLLVASALRAHAQTPITDPNYTEQRARSSDETRLSNLRRQSRGTSLTGFSLMPLSVYAPPSIPSAGIGPVAVGPNLIVQGSGTLGRLTKWTGFTSTNSSIGDSTIFEDKLGMVGIGTDTPTSRLTVAGGIESMGGGFKFPDGTVQTTAGLASVSHDASLQGDGAIGSPLGLRSGGVGTAHLADAAVTGSKIASGQVIKSLNGLLDNVTLAAGANVTITPSGNTLTIAASGADDLIQPFHRGAGSEFEDGQVAASASFTVPADRRLIIEYVSFSVSLEILPGVLTQEATNLAISTIVDGFPLSHHLVAVGQGTNDSRFPSRSIFAASQHLRLYADPGTPVTFTVNRSRAAAPGLFRAAVSGRLVDIP